MKGLHNKLLVIDDEISNIHRIKRNLLIEENDLDFDYITNIKEFKYWNATNRNLDVAIVDLNLGLGFEMEGVDIAKEIKKTHPECLVIIFSSSKLTPKLATSIDQVGSYFFSKSNDSNFQDIRDLIENHLSNKVKIINNFNVLHGRSLLTDRTNKNDDFNRSIINMIAGVNHEIRNIFVKIKQETIDISKESKNLKAKNQTSIEKHCSVIDRQLKRANEIMDLLSFDYKVKFCSIRKAIETSIDYFDLDTNDIVVSIFGNIEDIQVQGTETELNLIFFNLISNSVKALRSKSKGVKKINVELNYTEDKPFVEIGFNDNGVGIRAEYLKNGKIFTKGFTTYEHGQGNGLYIVKEIIEDAFNGNVSINSTSIKGTTVKFKLGITGHNNRYDDHTS